MVAYNKNRNSNIYCYYFYIVTLLLLLPLTTTKSQNKQAAIWHVGNKKLDFNTNPVSISDVSSPFLGTSGSLTLADDIGNLLLFVSAQTQTLYNGGLHELKNGNNIHISNHSEIIFIPKPENDTIVYLFTMNKYNIIDTKNDTVLSKNIVWTNKNYINLYAVHHINCNNIWLVGQTDSGALYSYTITKNGLSPTYVLSYRNSSVAHRGSISPLGKYYAMPGTTIDDAGTSNKDTVIIDYGEFNRFTGNFNNMYSYVFKNYNMCYATSFSEDETKLYLFMGIRNSFNTFHILQIQITNGIPDFDNATIISTVTNNGFVPISVMQLGIDGKIYHIFYMKRKINIIHNPNAAGAACNYEDNAIQLSTQGNNTPNYINTWFSANFCYLDFFADNKCLPTATNFNISNIDNIQSALWNFGDSQTSTELEPTHTYANAGTYSVTLTVTFNDNTTKTISKEITIYEKPYKSNILHD